MLFHFFCEIAILCSLPVCFSSGGISSFIFNLQVQLTLEQLGLNRAGPLIREFFSLVNITVLYDPQLAESAVVELGIWRNHI